MRILTIIACAKHLLAGRGGSAARPRMPLTAGWSLPVSALANIASGGGAFTSFAVRRDATLALALRYKTSDREAVAEVLSEAVLYGAGSALPKNLLLLNDQGIRLAGLCAAANLVELHRDLAAPLFPAIAEFAFSPLAPGMDGYDRHMFARSEAFLCTLPALVNADPSLAFARGLAEKLDTVARSRIQANYVKVDALIFLAQVRRLKQGGVPHVPEKLRDLALFYNRQPS